MQQNLSLSAEEAAAFWPVFQRYLDEKTPIIDAQIEAVRAYAAAYPTLDDAASSAYVQSLLERDAAIQALSDRGIGTSVHYVPLHRHPYWRDRYGLAPSQFPQADAAYLSMLSLPLFTAMQDADQDRVIAALHDILA